MFVLSVHAWHHMMLAQREYLNYHIELFANILHEHVENGIPRFFDFPVTGAGFSAFSVSAICQDNLIRTTILVID